MHSWIRSATVILQNSSISFLFWFLYCSTIWCIRFEREKYRYRKLKMRRCYIINLKRVYLLKTILLFSHQMKIKPLSFILFFRLIFLFIDLFKTETFEFLHLVEHTKGISGKNNSDTDTYIASDKLTRRRKHLTSIKRRICQKNQKEMKKKKKSCIEIWKNPLWWEWEG